MQCIITDPAYEVSSSPKYVDLYERKPKSINSFGIRVSPFLESANMRVERKAKIRN